MKCMSRLTGGALALVSGRPIVDLDVLFAPFKLPAVGGHGAELRVFEVISSAAPLPQDLRRHLAEAATPGSGSHVEAKGYSLRCTTATGRSTRIVCANTSRPAARH